MSIGNDDDIGREPLAWPQTLGLWVVGGFLSVLVIANNAHVSESFPWIVIQTNGEGAANISVALLALGGYLMLSAGNRQLLVPSSVHRPGLVAPTITPAKEELEAIAEPRQLFGFELPDRYLLGGTDGDFYEKACTYVDQKYRESLLENLEWAGTTPDTKLPKKGRPNHYFRFHLPGKLDGPIMIEVPHDGRSGTGASKNVREI